MKGATGLGVVTDIDGNYKINVKDKNAVLVFSYIGYTPQEVKIGGRASVDVTMKDESSVLKEVVVTAMGIKRKESSLTYSTQQVKASDLNRVQDPNVANSLEGKVSGVTITPSAGGAGGASKIILRGNNSILFFYSAYRCRRCSYEQLAARPGRLRRKHAYNRRIRGWRRSFNDQP